MIDKVLEVASTTWGCEGLRKLETGITSVEIGISGSEAHERGGGRGIESIGKLMSKVEVGESGLFVVDGSGTIGKALFRLVPWVVNCDPEWIVRAH